MGDERAPTDDAAAMRAREAALTRFGELEQAFKLYPEPAAAIAGIGWLYELLPPSARAREVDVSGVRALHRALSALGSIAHR